MELARGRNGAHCGYASLSQSPTHSVALTFVWQLFAIDLGKFGMTLMQLVKHKIKFFKKKLMSERQHWAAYGQSSACQCA